jgi:hypothetical protein
MVVGASFNGGGSGSQTPTARATGGMITSFNSDPVAAPLPGPLPGVTSVLNFDGPSAQGNRDVFGFAFVPPDTNGAVGATQFLQIVNVTIAVYDKSSAMGLAASARSGRLHSVPLKMERAKNWFSSAPSNLAFVGPYYSRNRYSKFCGVGRQNGSSTILHNNRDTVCAGTGRRRNVEREIRKPSLAWPETKGERPCV